MKKIIFGLFATIALATQVHAATVIATVNGKPITDTDVTARAQLLNRMGKSSTDNRRVALGEIIDDIVKIAYASNFNAVPEDKVIKQELAKMDLSDASAAVRDMAFSALRADIAWQIIVGRTILPTIDVTDEDVNQTRDELARERGLPIEMEIIRLIDIPTDVAKQLTRPKNCEDAMEIAERLGGAPQRFTALQYELSDDVRNRVVGLKKLTWSPVVDNSVLLVCNSKKGTEYGKLDDVLKQNTEYKQAMFMADQQLKQLRRKAIIVINDDRYKL